jgi:uncharacterized cupin superfamily protein
MPNSLRLTREGVTPEVTRPDPATVVKGDPVHTTWNVEEVDGLFCGLWASTPGAWRMSYAEWEYLRILEGRAIITDDEGPVHHLGPGDALLLRPGFSGVWETVEPILKDYVIRA